MIELIEELDEQGTVIAVHPKEELQKRMFIHKAALVLPLDPQNNIIISRRAKDKHPFPSTWCCALGGKVQAGETEEQAAAREMQEEIGITLPLQKITTFLYNQEDYKAFFTLFTTREPLLEKQLSIDPRETAYLHAFSLAELKEKIAQEPTTFAPTFLAALRVFLSHVT